MIRNFIKLGQTFVGRLGPMAHCQQIPRTSTSLLSSQQLNCGIAALARWPSEIKTFDMNYAKTSLTIERSFHAARSKVKYLDFRYKFPTNVTRTHLLIIRRQKMKKHRRRKWRKKFKSLLTKTRFKRVLAKEKMFRVELLSLIRNAEEFDPKEYAMRKIKEMNEVPKELTKEEKLERIKQLIRENRFETDYVKPKHKKLEE